MTGYQSKKAAAQDKLTQEPDVVMHWASHTWTTLNPPPKGSGDVNLYYAPAAQPEQEPVAWVDPATLYQLKIGLEGVHLVYETEMINSLPLYEKPQRTWVGLTDEEMQAVVDAQLLVSNINVYFKAIESKLREKNT
jgi:hypothetical protein